VSRNLYKQTFIFVPLPIFLATAMKAVYIIALTGFLLVGFTSIGKPHFGSAQETTNVNGIIARMLVETFGLTSYQAEGTPAFDFNLTSTVSSRIVTALNSTTYPINITCVGTSQNVTLSCSTSIQGVTYQIYPPAGFPPFLSISTVYTSSNTPTGNYTLTITGTGAGLVRSTKVQLEVQPQSPGTEWIIQTVDSNGGPSSIALDKAGQPHIAYGGYCLRYLSWNGSAWSNQTIQDLEHIYPVDCVSLRLTITGYPCIAFRSNSNIMYTSWNGSTWLTKPVDFEGHVDYFSSLSLDSKDSPCISFCCDDGSLRYAKLNGLTWNITTVDSDLAGGGVISTSLSLDSHDYPHIAYVDYNHNNYLLKYAIWNGSRWGIQTIDYCWGYISLALDSHNTPCIAYWGNDNKLKFASASGTNSSWLIQNVDSPTYGATDISLALDLNDQAHICYRENSVGCLKYAHWTGASWDIQKITTDDILSTSIEVDSKGYPHISGKDIRFNTLRYATPFDFNITSIVHSRSLKAGESTTFPINVTLSSEFTQNVTLTCSLPIQEIFYQFATPVGNPTFSSVLEVRTDSDTPAGDYSLCIYATAGRLTRATTAQLEVKENTFSSPTLLPSPTENSLPTPEDSSSPSPSSAFSPTPSPSIPEFPTWIALPITLAAVVPAILAAKKRNQTATDTFSH
jgi:hypothetical protein